MKDKKQKKKQNIKLSKTKSAQPKVIGINSPSKKKKSVSKSGRKENGKKYQLFIILMSSRPYLKTQYNIYKKDFL